MKKNLLYFFVVSLLLSFTIAACSSLHSKNLANQAVSAAPLGELGKFLGTKQSKNLAVIKFYADWCGTCKEYEPEFAKAKSAFSTANVDFYEINVDKKEYSALIKELKIGLIPITYFVSQDRKTIENRIGYIPASQLAEKLKSLNLK